MEKFRAERMGLFSSVAVIVGGCIGSAIFSISGMTLYVAGASAVVSWVLAAVIMGAYGVVVTRLAVRYPRSGGIFVFPRHAFPAGPGRVLGFVSGWGYIVSNTIAIGFSAIVAGFYFCAGFPEVCGTQAGSLIASWCAMMVSLIVIFAGGRRSQLLQNTLVVLLALTLLIFCATAFSSGTFDWSAFGFAGGVGGVAYGEGGVADSVVSGGLARFFAGGVGGPMGVFSAVPLAMVAYGGCVAIAFMSSEVRDPSRNVPRSLAIGLGVVALLYALVVAALVGTVPTELIRSDESLRFAPLLAAISDGGQGVADGVQVAISDGGQGVAGALAVSDSAAGALAGGVTPEDGFSAISGSAAGALAGCQWLRRLIAVASILAQLTTIIVLTRVNARAIQAIAAAGFLPRRLGRENSRGVLVAAVSVIGVAGLAICLLARWAGQIISLGALLNVVSITITCLAAVRSERLSSHSDEIPTLVGDFSGAYAGGAGGAAVEKYETVAAVEAGVEKYETVAAGGVSGVAGAHLLKYRHYKELAEAGAFRRLPVFLRTAFPLFVVVVLLCCYLPEIFRGGASLWIFTAVTYLVGMAIFLIYKKEHFQMSGVVVHGKGHGHQHGMPTANLSVPPDMPLPRFGVWAVRVLIDGHEYRGLTNVGLRPSDDDSQVPTVETYIIDYHEGSIPGQPSSPREGSLSSQSSVAHEGSLYGRVITLEFLFFVRPTRKFASLDELKVQIDKDLQIIREP